MKKIRKNGHITRLKILDAARKVFLEKGYSGASIDDIAKLADVTRSLIFHHYASKQELWKRVKAYVASDVADIVLDIPTTKGLRVFIERLIWYRFRVYETHPDLARLADWQRLEPEAEELKGTPSLPSFSSWEEAVCSLQEANVLRADLDPRLILTFMLSSLSGLRSEEKGYFEADPQRKQLYVQLAIDSLCAALAPEAVMHTLVRTQRVHI